MSLIKKIFTTIDDSDFGLYFIYFVIYIHCPNELVWQMNNLRQNEELCENWCDIDFFYVFDSPGYWTVVRDHSEHFHKTYSLLSNIVFLVKNTPLAHTQWSRLKTCTQQSTVRDSCAWQMLHVMQRHTNNYVQKWLTYITQTQYEYELVTIKWVLFLRKWYFYYITILKMIPIQNILNHLWMLSDSQRHLGKKLFNWDLLNSFT